jgi:hypothetical protein
MTGINSPDATHFLGLFFTLVFFAAFFAFMGICPAICAPFSAASNRRFDSAASKFVS